MFPCNEWTPVSSIGLDCCRSIILQTENACIGGRDMNGGKQLKWHFLYSNEDLLILRDGKMADTNAFCRI